MSAIELIEVLNHKKEFITIDDFKEYKRCRVQLHCKGIILRDIIQGGQIKTKSQQVCKEGQLLVAEIDAKLGGYGIIPNDLNRAIVSSHYFLFDIDESKLDRKYFSYYLKTPQFFSQIKAQGSTNYAAIRPKNILNIKMPLPSLEEQKKISRKLNVVFDNSTKISKNIESNESSVNNLRQSILQEAVQGKLVKQDPNDEPASELLKKIKTEKEKLINEGKIKKQKPLPPITEDDVPYELPKCWEWVRLGEVGQLGVGNIADDNLDVSFIPMALISEKYNVDIKFEIRKWAEIRKGFTHFKDNDIAVAKITPCFQNGKSCVMKNLKNGIGAGTTELHVFRGYNKSILPEYVLIFFKNPEFIKNGIQNMTGTAGQKRVPKSYIENGLFPFPTFKEQKRIVKKVDELMKLCDELEQNIKQSKKDSELLIQSVLQESFIF